MKKLFLYYSYSGNGDVVAKKFEENGYEIYKVTTKKRALPKSFFFGVLAGGMLAGMNHKTKINPITVDISTYDEIVIASPIWNGKLACPTNSILSELDLKGKNIRFVLYSGSGEGAKATKKINSLYPNAKIDFLQEPKKYLDKIENIF